jgi:hypothetical protein
MGGYYAGIIDTTKGNIIAADASQTGRRYALIVAPKSLQQSALQWRNANGASPAAALTRWDGLTATAALNSTTFPAANYCAGLTYPTDAASSWYLPAMDELELLYRYFKSYTQSNLSGSATATFPGTQTTGVNPSSDPTGVAYSSSVPGQTSVTAFRDSQPQAIDGFGSNTGYWSSTSASGTSQAWGQSFGSTNSGAQSVLSRTDTLTYTRPVRRLLL